jgi:hypothetical protein
MINHKYHYILDSYSKISKVHFIEVDNLVQTLIMMIMSNHLQSSTLEITIAAVIIATMLALSVVVLVIQEADAAVSKKVSFKQTQVNKCTECKM